MSKPINFEDAMNLAHILTKYEFHPDIHLWIPKLLENISPEDFYSLMSIFEINMSDSGRKVLNQLFHNFEDSKVIDLMKFTMKEG